MTECFGKNNAMLLCSLTFNHIAKRSGFFFHSFFYFHQNWQKSNFYIETGPDFVFVEGTVNGAQKRKRKFCIGGGSRKCVCRREGEGV